MTAVPDEPTENETHRVAGQVVDLALRREPTLGAGRLVAVDGPAGAGKTTLAAAVARVAQGRQVGCAVVHMDDLYAGWTGLPGASATVARMLAPLRTGRPGAYRRYDWVAGAFAEQVVVDPVDLLVVEGVGSGDRRCSDLVTVLVWVDAPWEVRVARGLARDGGSMRGHWERWQREEVLHHTSEVTRGRADLTLLTDPRSAQKDPV